MASRSETAHLMRCLRLMFSENPRTNSLVFKSVVLVRRVGEDCSGRSEAEFLRNGSAQVGGTMQVLQLEQHGEHPLQLAIEMDLIAGEAVESVRIYGFAERLCTN